MLKIIKKSIKTKIFLAILLPLVLVEGVLLYLNLDNSNKEFLYRYEQQAITISSPFIARIEQKLITLDKLADQKGFLEVYMELKGEIEFPGWVNEYENLTHIAFLDPGDKLLAATPGTNALITQSKEIDFLKSPHKSNGFIFVPIVLQANEHSMGYLIFCFSDNEIIKENMQALVMVGWILFLSMLFGSILAWFISSAITRPINQLALDSQKLSAGEIDHELCSLKSMDEIGVLAKNFRLMRESIREQLEELEEKNKALAKEIIERKQAEKEKIQAERHAAEQEKNAIIGQIAGKMAHDFNNILGIIMGNTELALLDCKDTNIQKTLELIYGQTIRGKNLTKNLVAFANDQEPKQEFFSINEKMDLIINLLRKDLEEIEMVKEKGSVPDLLADPGMIEHALVNFIQNAIHALGFVEHPQITIRTYSLDGNICFEIEDNGCGIPKEHLEKIYDPAFTLKGAKDATNSYKPHIKGTGYGMANIKKYIEQHNGVISVESTFGLGTRFIISLPVTEKELTQKEKVEIFKSSMEYEKSILLVEDESAISEVQYRILTGEPCYHKVDKADKGQVAIDLFEKNKYDVVSLDYILSGDMNGMDVYHHIRKTNKEIPILFISGNIEFLESIKELRQKDDNVRHLSKPCQNKRYVNHINWLLKKSLI
jgi:signal transduction histidine kinase